MTPARASRFWIANTAAWAVYGVVSLGLGIAFTGALASGFVLIAVGLAGWLCVASGVLRRLALRGRWLEREAWPMLARFTLAVALLAAAAQAGLAAMLGPALRLGWVTLPDTGAPYTFATTVGYWVNTVIVLALWTLAWAGWTLLRRARDSQIVALRAESERRALALDALRARLNPHFVFNALNNLRALILEEPERARELVTRLSSTLRHALEHSQHEWTTLGAELAVVRDYLAVEAVHYEDRLRVEFDVPEALHGTRVPPMAVQLLVENAIKHGIALTPGGGRIGIAGYRDGDALQIRVRNPGRLVGAVGGTGVGLAFLRHRLAAQGGRFELRDTGAGVEASLEVPQ